MVITTDGDSRSCHGDVGRRFRRLSQTDERRVIFLLVLFFIVTTACAHPVFDRVEVGQVDVQHVADSTVVHQQSPQAIIHWRSFNINKQEATHFVQPSHGIVLNRIDPTQGASRINGILTATGRIVLVNRAGIYFGPSAYVNVGGMIAATGHISNQDFLNQQYRFTEKQAGQIINEGRIIARENGLIALLGSHVSNNGWIEARLGKIVLASGSAFTIHFTEHELIDFNVDARSPSGQVVNTGKLLADGGSIFLTAKTAQNLLDHAINMQGIAEAKSIDVFHGEIILNATDQHVQVSGQLIASGKEAQQQGGVVKILGHQVILTDHASIDVSGDKKGGVVWIGGNGPGEGIEQKAKTVFFGRQAVVDASALTRGDGGQVVVWSQQRTQFLGRIVSQGGWSSGNGGAVEVSSYQRLDFLGRVNLVAPKGVAGTLLLDPENVTIQTAGSTNTTVSSNTYTSNLDSSIITVTDLQNALASANVTLQTGMIGPQAGDITVANSLTWSNTNTLTLSAYRNISINSGVTLSNIAGGRLTLRANNTGTGSAVGSGAGIVTNNGTLTFSGGGEINVFYNPSSYTSPVTYTNTGTAPVSAFMLVNNATDLQNMSNNLSGTYALGNSFTAGGSFTPIGNATTPFTGRFNGNFSTIRNLTINTATAVTGLFGQTSNALIENVALINASVASSGATSSFSFGDAVGILVGYATGTTTIRNIAATGSASYNSTISVANTVGGLIGYLNTNAQASNVYCIATASSTTGGAVNVASVAGGLVGTNAGTLSNGYTGGTVVASGGGLFGSATVGGLVGTNSGTLSNTYSVVPSITTSGLLVVPVRGGLVGNNSGSVATSYWNNTILTGLSTCGLNLGTCNGTGQSTANMQTQSTFTGFNFSTTWGITSGNYPYLLTLAPRIVSGTVPTTGGTVSLYDNGTLLSSQVIASGTGTFSFSSAFGTIPDLDPLLIIVSGFPSHVNNVVAVTPLAGADLTGLAMTTNGQITLGGSNYATVNHATFSGAAGSLSSSNLLYSVSGNNLTLGNATTTNVSLVGSLPTFYTVNGTVNPTGGGAATLNFSGPVGLNNNVTSNANQTYGLPVTLGATSILTGATLSLQQVQLESNTLTLNTSSLSSQIANTVSGTGGLTLSGTSSGVLTLSAANTYSGATNVNAGIFSLTHLNALGSTSGTTVSSGATLDVNVSGTLGNSNTISLAGTGVSNTGALRLSAANITIPNPISLSAHSLISGTGSGTMVLNGAISGGVNLTVTLSNAALSLPQTTLTSGGQLAVTTNGAITQTGALSIAGTSSFTAGSSAINLTTNGGSNTFTGAVSLANSGTNQVTLTNNTALILGASSVGSGTLDLIFNGSLSEIGALTQASGAGAVTLTGTSSPADIQLNTQGNDLSGAVSFGGTLSYIRDVLFRNINNSATLPTNLASLVNLRHLSVQFDNAAITFPAVTLTSGGNLSAIAGGAIAQTGTLTVPGTASFNAGSHAIDLTTNGGNNAFTGTVTLANSGSNDVTITNHQALVLGASTIGQQFTATADGLLTIAGNVLSSNNGAISLTGTGITVNANTTVTTSNSITALAGANALTLNSGSQLLTSGVIQLIADILTFNTSATPSQVGGTATNTGSASHVLMQPHTAGTTMGLAGGAGSLQLTASMLNDVRATNVYIGNSSAGNMQLGAWTPSATFAASGVLTLDTAGTITQSGALNLATSASSLLLRDASTVTLSSSNTLSAIAATLPSSAVLTLANVGSSALTVASLTDHVGTVSGISAPNSVTLTSTSSGMVLNAPVSASGAGTAIVLAGTSFTNNNGASALSPGSGSFNVWSTNPANDNRGGIAYHFKQYQATYGVTPVLGTGNGFLYSIAPTISTSLTGTVSKIYDGTTTATLTSSQYTAPTGAIDGDVVTLNNPTSGVYDTKNVGTNKNVSVPSIAISSATNGSATVYGYQVNTPSATIGTITALSLHLTGSRTYDATADFDGSQLSASNIVSGDTVTLGGSATVSSQNVGTYTSFVTNNLTSSNTNYSVTGGTVNVAITPEALGIHSNAGETKVYGHDDPSSAALAYSITSGSLFGSDALTGNMGRAIGETVGSYSFTQNTVIVDDGNSGNNYTITFDGSTHPFVITSRLLTASIVNQVKGYGTNDPALNSISVTLGNVANLSVTDINGHVTVIDDTGQVSTTLASLTRTAGELVSSSPYGITGATFAALSGSAASNYSGPSGLSGSSTLTITAAPLTATIANQTKVYGQDDPALAGIAVNLSGVVNRSVTDWMGNVTAINDTSQVSTTLASLTRIAGELVSGSPYGVTGATFTALSGSAASNYSGPSGLSGSPTLTITTAPLTAAIANQTKVYGQDDPALAGITVNLSGVVNRSVTDWMGNVTAINDTGQVSTTLASLTRTAGELVANSPYAVTGSTLNALSGSAASNYSGPSGLSGSPTLTITTAPLTAAMANQTKVYGQDDPALAGITVNLSGVVNRSVTNWMGNVTAINDTGQVSTTLASLTRTAGELVSGSPYGITGSTLNALSGSAASNYSGPSGLSGSPTLTITTAPLTATMANQTKVYGQDDPALAGITVNLSGVVNRSVTNWMGNVTAINDTSQVSTTLASLTRTAGELVSSSPYGITGATFTALSGSAASNYSGPSGLNGSPTLTITAAPLTATMVNQTKVYGQDDPALAGITVNLSGVVNRSVTDWMGNVTAINDTGQVSTTLASLTRTAGELVANSPYAVTGSTLNALSGSAASNYSGLGGLSGSPILTITAAPLTATIANQTKAYGQDDPALVGIVMNLGGIVNRSVTDWMGNVTAINDTGQVSTTLASLARTAGELVSGSPYGITGATFAALSGSAASNYSGPSGLSGSPTLTITPVPLTITPTSGQNKLYGTNDPSAGFLFTDAGLIQNTTVTSWNSTQTVINDTIGGHLGRVAGENVGTYTYNLGNIPATLFSDYTIHLDLEALAIVPTSLTIDPVPGQSKAYGMSDPLFTYNETGLIHGVAPQYWNSSGDFVNGVLINDTISGHLGRAAGENVGTYAYHLGSIAVSTPLNYNMSLMPGTFAITPAILTASLTGTVSKEYDTTVAATLTGSNYVLTGVIDDDAVQLHYPTAGFYDNANVGIHKSVSVSGLFISGAGESNYQLASGTISGNVGWITPAALTISGVIANNKIYDQTTMATLNLSSAALSGVYDRDTVYLNFKYGADFAHSSVGNHIPVIIHYIGLAGAQAGNYVLIMPTDLYADILPNHHGPSISPESVSPIIQQADLRAPFTEPVRLTSSVVAQNLGEILLRIDQGCDVNLSAYHIKSHCDIRSHQ